MNKQITTCKIDVKANNGVSNFSFQGYPKNVSVYSGGYRFTPYYYGGTKSDEALSGRKRSRLGGYRFEANLNWERLIDTDNLGDVVNKATIGREKNFWTGQVDDSYSSKSNIVIPSGPSQNDALNGMRMEISGSGNYTITDYYASNTTAILNTSITLGGTEAFNVVALSNMTPSIYLFPDASANTNEEVILEDTTWELALESTVVNQPLSVSFVGANVSNTIPSYYDL